MSFKLDFVGGGDARCGTTWIAECIDDHPDLYISSKKEIHFFDYDRKFKKGLDHYRKFFKDNTKDLIQGEYTPRYLLYRESLSRIKKLFPDVKIIISLRDLIERAISQFSYFRFNKKKEVEKSFLKALTGYYREDYLKKSKYAFQIKNVLKIFDEDRVLFLLYDDIDNSPGKVVESLYDFLDVNRKFKPEILNKIVNKSRDGYFEPTRFWARYMKLIQNVNGRIVGGEVIRKPSIKNSVVKKILRNRFTEKVYDEINSKLDLFFGSENKVNVSQQDKKVLYEKYFKSDIDYLEETMERDLSDWRY